MQERYELVIVGGGPAGLSAALVAARARRSVLLADGGPPRNVAAAEVHTFLTRDGTPPREFRRIAREQLAEYPTVDTVDDFVDDIARDAETLIVSLRESGAVTASRVLLATGLLDILPDIDGLSDYWGKGVHHCPYCDGYPYRDGPWGVFVDEASLFDHALFMTAWTRDLTAFTNGAIVPADDVAPRLQAASIAIETQKIARVRGGARLEAIELTDGRSIPLRAFWVRPKQRQTALVNRLELVLNDDGSVWRSAEGETSMAGVYAAGDLSAGPLQQAILAAAEGARVTFGINRQLVQAP